MEITAALFAAVAPLQLIAPESPGVLFSDAFTEAVSTEPVEPSAWTLLNPVVVQEVNDTERPALTENSDEPQSSEQVVLAAPQPPLLPPKPPLQLEFPSKELTDGVKKLSIDNGFVARANDDADVPSKAAKSHRQTPRSIDPAAQHIAFTARISKADIPPQVKETGVPVKHLRPPLPGGTESRPSKLQVDESRAAERSAPFVETWQRVEIETPVEPQPVQPSSAPTAITEQPDIGRTEPVRQISLDVQGVEGQLRIRIAERAGEMRAWVTGEASATVEKVQAGISDLSRALSNAGFESEVWTPHTINAPTSASGVQTSTEQNDQNLFDGSNTGSGNNHHGSGEDNRQTSGDDDDDQPDFRSYMRNS